MPIERTRQPEFASPLCNPLSGSLGLAAANDVEVQPGASADVAGPVAAADGIDARVVIGADQIAIVRTAAQV